VGLAVAIAIDATMVRCLLVSAVMVLLGKASWWLPGWLGRLVPRISIEGEQYFARRPIPAPQVRGAAMGVELSEGFARTRVRSDRLRSAGRPAPRHVPGRARGGTAEAERGSARPGPSRGIVRPGRSGPPRHVAPA
jgi:hypothetical protein